MPRISTNQKTWWSGYLGYLASLTSASSDGGRKDDLGALSELRASARGGTFEIRALRHVVPYLSDPDAPDFDGRVKVALLVGQVFSLCKLAIPPKESAEDNRGPRHGGTIGRKIGILDARRLSTSDAGKAGEARRRTPTATERFFHTLVATDFDGIGNRLRNAAARIHQAGIEFTYDDYGQLTHDLYWWDDDDHRVQYRWVEDFYRTRYQGENKGTDEEENHDEE